MQSFRLSLIVILALVWGVLGISQAQAADQRPNILLVVADDMGWTDLGSFGSEIETPHLDALAQRGAKFTSFYAARSYSDFLIEPKAVKRKCSGIHLDTFSFQANFLSSFFKTFPTRDLGKPSMNCTRDGAL